MAQLTEQARGGSRRDVARFLAEHELCASDFQIRRFSKPGHGGLSVICNGCGNRAAYELGEPGKLKPVAPDTAGSAGEHRVSREEVERWLPAPAALPWWVPNAYILGVIIVGLAMIAFGVLRTREGEHHFGGQGSGIQPPAEEQRAAPPAKAQVAAGAPARGKPEKRPNDGRSDRGRTDLDHVTVLNRFEIGVPSGWSGGMSAGAVVFRPSGDEVELRVFLEPGAQRPPQLFREARELLEDTHPGARLTRPDRLRLGGDPAIRVGARYPGGEEWATVLSKSGYSYLLLSRVGGGAPAPVARQAEAALASFHAL